MTSSENIDGISVIIPVYNSAPTLNQLMQRLSKVIEQLGLEYEVILVNDGSRDTSWQQIETLQEHYPRLHGINLMRNYGQHNATLAGIRRARYSVIVTLDDDLQNPPEEISRLLAKLVEGYDVVYGTPTNQQHGLWRNLASQITKLALQSFMGVETARNVSAYRAFRTQVREAFTNYGGSFVSIDVLLTWGTSRFAAVPVREDERLAGVSNYTFRKLVIHAINMITGFSMLPLQIASLLGFAFTLFGVGIFFYVLSRYFKYGRRVPAGFPFLASIIAIFSGVQLFALGVIGEYLARIHFRMMERPSYVEREVK